jgi:hypothetical protein
LLAYRDKRVVGVFVRFSCAASSDDFSLVAFESVTARVHSLNGSFPRSLESPWSILVHWFRLVRIMRGSPVAYRRFNVVNEAQVCVLGCR